MIRLFEFLIHGCWHQWKTMEISTIVNSKGTAIGTRFYYQCEKCHHVKKLDV